MPLNEVKVTAPAKVNLYLHVVGKRPDGYHLLDSLFAFTEFGDSLSVSEDETLSLEITGPFARNLPVSKENIVIQAAEKLAEALGIEPKAKIILEKNLPVASGIGGGSSDAAAALKALTQLWAKPLPENALYSLALSLGADVPACLSAKAVQVSGIGEVIQQAPPLPESFILLVNPNRPVSTPAVFQKRSGNFSAADPLTKAPENMKEFIFQLGQRRNDLANAARLVEPAVDNVLKELENSGKALISRMSGSGGTCFALFDDQQGMEAYASFLKKKYPDWWIQSTKLV